ncbi:hypothetical protein V3C99_014440 [Haemonchus contortus]
MTILVVVIALSAAVQSVSSQVVSKTVIDFCSTTDNQSCGPGQCIPHSTGNRCKCPLGWMGRKCARPCQDVYRSCKRWREEERCSWTRPISPFFTDNCALSCGLCQSSGRRLPLTLPPILDNIAWFVGRWESKTTQGDNFPESLSGPYREILEVQISDVPMFDRPPVNISRTAVTMDGRDIYTQVGFMTSKPFKEDTGFVEFNKPTHGDDLVAIESVGNNGQMIIEEGIVRNNAIKLETKFKRSFFGDHTLFKQAKRMFLLVRPDILEERVIITDKFGVTKKWLKRFKRTFNYLEEFVRDTDVNDRS